MIAARTNVVLKNLLRFAKCVLEIPTHVQQRRQIPFWPRRTKDGGIIVRRHIFSFGDDACETFSKLPDLLSELLVLQC